MTARRHNDDVCGECQKDEEGRDARCSACPCVERTEIKRAADRTHKVLAGVAATLQLGIEGVIPEHRALTDAFALAFGHLYGPDDALRIIAEGVRHDL